MKKSTRWMINMALVLGILFASAITPILVHVISRGVNLLLFG